MEIMNEKIKELAEQSGVDFSVPIFSANDKGREFRNFDIEKFAELVEQNVDVSKVYLDGKTDGRVEGIREVIEYVLELGQISVAFDLKNHFGVE